MCYFPYHDTMPLQQQQERKELKSSAQHKGERPNVNSVLCRLLQIQHLPRFPSHPRAG